MGGDIGMRIAIVTHLFPVDAFPGGGVQAATYHLCKALVARSNVELVVVRPLSRKADLGCVEYDGIRMIPLEYRLSHTRLIALLWTQGRQVRRALKALKPDIVHIQDSSLLGLFVRDPSVFTLHGLVERDARYHGAGVLARVRSLALYLTYGLARRRLRNVIAISPYTESVLPPHPGRRFWNIPNAVGDRFFEITPSPVRPTILYAGHITPLKNVLGLIRGFAGLVAGGLDAMLRVAGPGQDSGYGQECRQLVKELGLEKRVWFLGVLDVGQLQQELAGASLLALCSRQENAPMCIAEAMAASVPVVASRLGGIPWMLDDGRCGCLIDDPLDAGQITAAMRRALEPEQWAEFSRAAKKRAEMFRASRVAEQTVGVYREILKREG
jgi:glycosyltransferase involved in cell wall biosynthesis